MSATAHRACDDALAHPTQREAWTRAKRQLEALDAAWAECEKRGKVCGPVVLTELQVEYCSLAGVPLRWSETVTW